RQRPACPILTRENAAQTQTSHNTVVRQHSPPSLNPEPGFSDPRSQRGLTEDSQLHPRDPTEGEPAGDLSGWLHSMSALPVTALARRSGPSTCDKAWLY